MKKALGLLTAICILSNVALAGFANTTTVKESKKTTTYSRPANKAVTKPMTKTTKTETKTKATGGAAGMKETKTQTTTEKIQKHTSVKNAYPTLKKEIRTETKKVVKPEVKK